MKGKLIYIVVYWRIHNGVEVKSHVTILMNEFTQYPFIIVYAHVTWFVFPKDYFHRHVTGQLHFTRPERSLIATR